mmetsp:Transcript_19518/g.31970  ORF Transcript_19518/g.31970 Transcript_19518/m.31970 type:complete len:249 (+) Transcript_19518:1874-2620(+)
MYWPIVMPHPTHQRRLRQPLHQRKRDVLHQRAMHVPILALSQTSHALAQGGPVPQAPNALAQGGGPNPAPYPVLKACRPTKQYVQDPTALPPRHRHDPVRQWLEHSTGHATGHCHKRLRQPRPSSALRLLCTEHWRSDDPPRPRPQHVHHPRLPHHLRPDHPALLRPRLPKVPPPLLQRLHPDGHTALQQARHMRVCAPEGPLQLGNHRHATLHRYAAGELPLCSHASRDRQCWACAHCTRLDVRSGV